MRKCIIIKKVNGKYKISKFIRFKIRKNIDFKFEYQGKLYSKEIKSSNKEITQISLLIEALNIKDKKQRLEFVYDKSCDLLDDDFYGKNICEFKNNRCMHDRIHASSMDGCCRSNDNEKKCKYINNHMCSIRCLACKFHICYCVRQKGYKYKVNDILMLKYLYNWKQKIIAYNNFFMTKEETLKDVYRNSIIYWVLFNKTRNFIDNKTQQS